MDKTFLDFELPPAFRTEKVAYVCFLKSASSSHIHSDLWQLRSYSRCRVKEKRHPDNPLAAGVRIVSVKVFVQQNEVT